MPGFQPRIAIAGGGPSGLALGLLLSRQNIRTTIYELRRKPTPEELAKPSGMLDLHEESGLKAMRECGLWRDFQAAVGDCSESTRVMGPNGVVLHTDEGELAYRPEIPRHALNDLLARQVPGQIIKWGHKIVSARRAKNAVTGATEVNLNLSIDRSETYDLVIGADGAWSRIRHLLSDITPTYGGAQMLTATMTQVSSRFPHLKSLNGSGTLGHHRPDATLIGDAAHLMMPWAGEGVNLALWDALDLARVLITLPEAADAFAWQSALGPRLREFEEAMQARAQEKAEETIKNRDLLLGEHGAQRLVSLFQRG